MLITKHSRGFNSERETGLGPATSALGKQRSTN